MRDVKATGRSRGENENGGIRVGSRLGKILPYMLMYYVAIIGGLLLVTYIPAVSMALPQLTGLV